VVRYRRGVEDMKICSTILKLIFVISFLLLFLKFDDVHSACSNSNYIEMANMPRERAFFEAYSHSGFIYCFIGITAPFTSNSYEHNVYRYDVAADQWDNIDSLQFAGNGVYSAQIGDNVYFAGGAGASGIRDSVFRYNIVNGQTDTLAPLPAPFVTGKAFNNSGQFHLLGGHNGSAPTDINLVYDPNLDLWTSGLMLPIRLERHCLARIDSLAFMIGGRTGGSSATNVNLVYNINASSFSFRANLPVAVMDAACAILNGEIYIFGGRLNVPPNNDLTDSVQIYNPLTDTWRFGPSIPFPNSNMSAVTFGDAIYLMGGWDWTTGTDRVFKYTPTRTICVPANQPTIQAAIDTAVNGDTVLVSPGTYAEHINFNGKSIVVMSSDGPDSTTITKVVDGLSIILFTNSEDNNSLIEGFTIRGARSVGQGGAINCSGTSPRIKGNVFTDNEAISGSCIHTISGSPIITNNLFYLNGRGEGVLHSRSGSAVIKENTIVRNNSDGILLQSLINNDTVVNNIVAFNTKYGIFRLDLNSPFLNHNDIYGNYLGDYFGIVPGIGSISEDPLFCDTSNNSYSLAETSPCVGAGEGGTTMGALGVGCQCCIGTRGDLNGDGNDANILDLTFAVDRIFRGGLPSGCPAESDVNADGTPLNILDLTYLVDVIFRGGPVPPGC